MSNLWDISINMYNNMHILLILTWSWSMLFQLWLILWYVSHFKKICNDWCQWLLNYVFQTNRRGCWCHYPVQLALLSWFGWFSSDIQSNIVLHWKNHSHMSDKRAFRKWKWTCLLTFEKVNERQTSGRERLFTFYVC